MSNLPPPPSAAPGPAAGAFSVTTVAKAVGVGWVAVVAAIAVVGSTNVFGGGDDNGVQAGVGPVTTIVVDDASVPTDVPASTETPIDDPVTEDSAPETAVATTAPPATTTPETVPTTTAAPATAAPDTTAAPATTTPASTAPATTAPATTAPATTAPPATVAPVVTVPPATTAPAPATSTVRFGSSSASLDSAAVGVLEQVLAELTARPASTALITGHTDSLNSTEFNAALSQSRADVVTDWLVDRGVDAARVTAEGRGETEPISGNSTAAERSANRRAEITITG